MVINHNKNNDNYDDNESDDNNNDYNNVFIFSVYVAEQMDCDDQNYLEALEKETQILEKRVEACKSRIMMVTCFDVNMTWWRRSELGNDGVIVIVVFILVLRYHKASDDVHILENIVTFFIGKH